MLAHSIKKSQYKGTMLACVKTPLLVSVITNHPITCILYPINVAITTISSLLKDYAGEK